MPSFQCRKLLAKSQVFEKQPATTLEELEDHTRQEYKRVNHVRVLSCFACEWQCHILLKSQADRILARGNGRWSQSLLSYAHEANISPAVDDQSQILIVCITVAERRTRS
jgi:hypothetical protein